MHVVIVDEELPYPANSGKRIRSLNLTLRAAARGHRVTYLCHRNAERGEAREAAEFFREHGIEPVLVDRAVPARSGAGFYARLGCNLLSPLPYSVASHTSGALVREARRLEGRGGVDLWHCEWTPYAQVARRLGVARWLVMAHNVESRIWERYYETEESAVKRWYIKRQWRKYERFERQVFVEATQVVTVSEEDAALARERFGAARVAVVDNGVDTAHFRPSGGARRTNEILLLGSLDWRPNLDAARLMLERVFPEVVRAEPGARLSIVGRNPPGWLARAVERSRGAELHANVPDVRPFLQQCGVLAVPLRVGGGSRLKILEALASEMPVVSTRVGAEGLRLEGGREVLLVEGYEGMAELLVDCMRCPERAGGIARAGRRRVVERYDWSALSEKLEEVWAACANGEVGNGRTAVVYRPEGSGAFAARAASGEGWDG